MRRFKSLGAGGWKSAILKIKMNKKKPAFTLALGALSIFCFLMIAQSFVFLTNGAFAAIQSDRVAAQAQANSFLDISILQNIDYYDLDQKGAHPRQQLQGVSDGSWESEVTIGPEHNLIDADDPDAKVRIATVKIYRAGDSVSRYSVDVPLTSTMSTDGVPVGGVVAMPTSTFPSESFKKRYLFCDGSTFSTSKYPKLAKVLHGNRLPDMRGKFAEGSQSPSGAWTYHRAGLPNIKGMLRASNSPHDVFLADVISSYSGAFYTSSMGGKWGALRNSGIHGSDLMHQNHQACMDAARLFNRKA